MRIGMHKYVGIFATSLLFVGCSPDAESGICGNTFDNGACDKVFFKFDEPRPGSQALDCHSQETVKKQAEYLKCHKGVNVDLQGHCDERGGVEYNLALGERRADAVKHAMVAEGVEEARIQTHSFGKNNPPVPSGSVPGMDEEVRHAHNRVVLSSLCKGADSCSEGSCESDLCD